MHTTVRPHSRTAAVLSGIAGGLRGAAVGLIGLAFSTSLGSLALASRALSGTTTVMGARSVVEKVCLSLGPEL
jgi:hypothetical protein